jgi:hypothetical protein
MVAAPKATGSVTGPARARVGYLIRSDDDAAMIALGDLLRHGYRVHVFDQPTALGGEKCPKGTLRLRTGENPESLHEFIRRAALDHGLSVVATDTGLVDSGAGLGGVHVSWVKPPRVAMLVDRLASPYAGHTWYLFDQVWHYPLTRVPGSALSELDLSKYNVLILPDGRYPGPLGEPFVARLRDWVRGGGTLIFVTFGSPEEVFPLINTDLILAPIKPTDGRNLVNFASRDVLVSGFCWPGALELMAGKPLVLYQSLGKGHIVAFSDDPNYRAMTPTTQRFFLNAVFLGPGH